MLATGALLSMTGCQRDVAIDQNSAALQPLKDDVQVYLRVNPVTGKAESLFAMKPQGNGELLPRGELLNPKSDLAAFPKPAAPDDPTSTHTQMQDYVYKSDAYWKLNGVRKSLLSGIVPPHMMTGLEDARRSLQRTTPDGNFDMAIDAINHLERGLIHMQTDQALQASGVDVQMAPWSLGSTAIRRFADRNLLGHRMPAGAASDSDVPDSPEDSADSSSSPSAPFTPVASPAKRAAAELMKKYAAAYSQAPEIMMCREFSKAIVDTNRLRDNLHLANRPENSDGDRSDVDPTLSRAGINQPAGGADVMEVKRLVDQMIARDTLGIASPIP
jgi:hypothetical protein